MYITMHADPISRGHATMLSRFAPRVARAVRAAPQLSRFNLAVPPVVVPPPAPKKRFLKVKFALWATPLALASYGAWVLYADANPNEQQPQVPVFPNGNKKKTVVILGSGWALILLLKNMDTTAYNVIVVLPRNYFLFTPLLPLCPTGTIEYRSIMEPVRCIAKRTAGEVKFYEAECTDIDPVNLRISIKQSQGEHSETCDKLTSTIDYDYLVLGVGAKTNTFGIPGVEKYSLYLKEVPHAQAIRAKFMDCVETATLLPKGSAERKRLLHTVVVGGGPTGVEFAAELQDYIHGDISKWHPEVADELKITLVEALPHVLNMMNERLINFTTETMENAGITIDTQMMVKKVEDTVVHAVSKTRGTEEIIPYGMLVWAGGNGPTDLVKLLQSKIEEQKNARRGLLINDQLVLQGAQNIFALGDCTFHRYAPTAQVAAQEGAYLAKTLLELATVDNLEYELRVASDDTTKERLRRRLQRHKDIKPFEYNHKGALAYVGSDKAVADLVWAEKGWWNVSKDFAIGGKYTFLFWKGAQLQMMLSTRNQVLVFLDWFKVTVFGRDVSQE